MFLSKNLAQSARTTFITLGVIGLSAAGTQLVQAAQFFDFTTTWSDGSSGSGSFSLSDTPTEIRLINELDYEFFYSSKTWNPLQNFTYSYLGRTYTSSNASFTIDDYPDGRYYANQYGSFLKDFNFSIKASNFYTFMYLVDAEIDSQDTFQGISQSLDANNKVVSSSYLTSITLRERTVQGETPSNPGTGGSAPEPPASQSVPEPEMIGSLFLFGLGMIASGRKLTAQRAA